MTSDFESLLDPRAEAGAASDVTTEPSREDAPASRGIPEVTRPKSRLAVPAMILGATLVTGGFVYSVSTAGEAAPRTQTVAPPEPPAAPTLPPGVSAAEAVPVAEAPPAPRQPARAATTSSWDDERQRRREDAARRLADARAHAAERLRSPLIVGSQDSAIASAAPGAAVRLGGGNGSYLASASEGETPTARARVLGNQGALVAQGTLVPGVLETAINSDLPGLLRAVVTADISSFDGQRTLIPRGSRLIGQYRSGIAVGQTRAFVVWTRLITPEGVSIQLGSPGTDALGRAGVTGAVDTHFFQRFGAALLLSIVGSAGQAAANAAGDGDEITINAAGDASRVAEQALQSSVNIPPTIKVRQGTPIRIFVARDLDFSGASIATSQPPSRGG